MVEAMEEIIEMWDRVVRYMRQFGVGTECEKKVK